VQFARERLEGLQEKLSGVKLENMGLDQRVRVRGVCVCRWRVCLQCLLAPALPLSCVVVSPAAALHAWLAVTPLPQQLSEKAASEASLLEHQRQMRDALDKKVTEFQQLMGIVTKLKADQEAAAGASGAARAWHDSRRALRARMHAAWQCDVCAAALRGVCGRPASTHIVAAHVLALPSDLARTREADLQSTAAELTAAAATASDLRTQLAAQAAELRGQLAARDTELQQLRERSASLAGQLGDLSSVRAQSDSHAGAWWAWLDVVPWCAQVPTQRTQRAGARFHAPLFRPAARVHATAPAACS
jgi:hypothetical protein